MSPVKKQLVHQQPLQEVRLKPTQKRKVKKKGLYSLRGIVAMSVVGVFLLLLGKVHLDGQINQLHYQVEQLKLQIDQQVVANEELYSKISELSTYSRAMEIAKANGLMKISLPLESNFGYSPYFYQLIKK